MTLATQNPVDLDYKALANAGTWFLGRLQTERDKARLLDGLEGAQRRLGSRLRPRHHRSAAVRPREAHVPAPQRARARNRCCSRRAGRCRTCAARWAGKNSRGSRRGTRRVQPVQRCRECHGAGAKSAQCAVRGAPSAEAHARCTSSTRAPAAPAAPPAPLHRTPGTRSHPWHARHPCSIPPSRNFSPRRRRALDAGARRRRAHHLLRRQARDRRRRATSSSSRRLSMGRCRSTGSMPSRPTSPCATSSRHAGTAQAVRGRCPPAAANPREVRAVDARTSRSWVGQSQVIELFRALGRDWSRRAAESERDFRIRLQTTLREQRDAEIANACASAMRRKLATLNDRCGGRKPPWQREQEQATESKMQAGVSVAATIFGAIMGRKAVSASTLGRATTAARGVRPHRPRRPRMSSARRRSSPTCTPSATS